MECFALDLKGATHFRGVVTNFSTYFTFIKAWAMTTWLNKEDTMLDFGYLHMRYWFQSSEKSISNRNEWLFHGVILLRVFLTEWNSNSGTVTRSVMTFFGGIIYGQMRTGRDSLRDKSCPETCKHPLKATAVNLLRDVSLKYPLQSTDLGETQFMLSFSLFRRSIHGNPTSWGLLQHRFTTASQMCTGSLHC